MCGFYRFYISREIVFCPNIHFVKRKIIPAVNGNVSVFTLVIAAYLLLLQYYGMFYFEILMLTSLKK